MMTWIESVPARGVGNELATGEGEKGCALHDCAYMPEELKVFCPNCLFDFSTMEGNPPCDDPMSCEHGEEARGNVANVESWKVTTPSMAETESRRA